MYLCIVLSFVCLCICVFLYLYICVFGGIGRDWIPSGSCYEFMFVAFSTQSKTNWYLGECFWYFGIGNWRLFFSYFSPFQFNTLL